MYYAKQKKRIFLPAKYGAFFGLGDGRGSTKKHHLWTDTSYEHWWNAQLNSTVVYGFLEADNPDFQSQDGFKKTQYTSANLVWQPAKNMFFGIEGLWGKREDTGGADGTDFRTLFTTKYSF